MSAIIHVLKVVWFRRVHLQKQPPEVLVGKDVLKNFAKFTVLESLFFLFFFFYVRCGEIWLG